MQCSHSSTAQPQQRNLHAVANACACCVLAAQQSTYALMLLLVASALQMAPNQGMLQEGAREEKGENARMVRHEAVCSDTTA